MKKGLFLVIFLVGNVLSISAQSLPAKVKVGKPELLKPAYGTYKRSDLLNEFKPGSKWGQKKVKQEFWQVWSDRDNNPVYSDASRSKQVNRRLVFGERVVIAEISGDMALVYEDNRMEKYPEVPSYAKYIGWVPMENLLLWGECPTDERGVTYKALIAININKIGGGKDFKGKYYKSPVGNVNPQALAMDMNFYFIMKETPGGERALLCLNPTVSGNNLYGWVDENSFARWDQRACLEPNWDPQYAESHAGKEVCVYSSQGLKSGDEVTRWAYGKSNGDKQRWFQYRMSPSQLRFPILETVNEQANQVHCTSFADRSKRANVSAEVTSGTATVEKVRQERRQMNLIFVTEGTTDMRGVLPAVKKSLAKCKGLAGQGLQVKVGLVLYRNESAESVLEIVPLTSYDDPLLLSRLDESKANGRLSVNEHDVSLSQAIEKASMPSTMGFKKDQNNLLIVIGNRGAPVEKNNLADPSLLKRLVDNNIQLMSIQVMQNQTGSWVNFNNQMIQLIGDNVKRQYLEFGERADFKQRPDGDGYNFYSKKNENGKDKSVLFAQIRYPKELGKQLTAAEITKYIDNGIDRYSKVIATWSERFEQALGDIQFDTAFLKKFLGSAGFQNWEKVRAISAFDGYTPLKDHVGNDYWHYILYLSGGELQKLLSDLKPAYEVAVRNEDDRNAYVNAMRSIVKAHLGQKDDKGIDNMSEDELQQLIYGLNVHTEMTNVRKLGDIADRGTVTAVEYRKMLSDFKKKYEKLEELYKEGYTYRVKLDKDWYYWIPIEDLP